MVIKDRYVIEREIGRGGIGVVYLAHDRQLYGKPVVIKVLLENNTEPNAAEWFVRHFKQESEALARINHPGVVGILDAGELPDGRTFLVMQFVEGVTLRSVLEETAHLHGLPLPRAAKLLRQIAGALHAAHRKNIIHRDLKPENIMVQMLDDGEEQVRLIDFGIASVKDSRYKDTWRTTTIAGTISYMSPEQLRGNPLPASDIYALGVIAYEMLTGHVPFNPHSHFEMLEKQRAGVAIKPSDLRADLPTAAETLILQALAYEATERPAHLPDFGVRLEKALIGQTGSPSGTTPLTRPLAWSAGTMLAGRYQLLQRLGGSLHSTVYLAHDLQNSSRQIALKEIHSLFAPVDNSITQKAFEQEARLMAGLSHPAIPPLYHYFFDADTSCYYLVNRYVKGRTLAEYQQQAGGKISEIMVTRWAIELCEVLEYLHAKTPPILFGDFKPSNLIFDDETNHLQLLDFGLARLVTPVSPGKLPSHGTLGYIAPERFKGKGDSRSDIYSLGALLFHLLTGSDPTELPLLIFDFNQQAKPCDLVPEMTKPMDRMICRAVESKPENRFPSASEWKQELIAHLDYLKTTETLNATNKMLLCPNCHREVTPQAFFCRSCGVRLRALAQLTLQSENYPSLPPFLLEASDTLIGRADPKKEHFPDVDLTRFDPTASVSRKHVVIKQQKGQFLLEDCNSSNGTFLDDSARLPAYQPFPLNNGAMLKLGEVRLKFELLDGEAT